MGEMEMITGTEDLEFWFFTVGSADPSVLPVVLNLHLCLRVLDGTYLPKQHTDKAFPYQKSSPQCY